MYEKFDKMLEGKKNSFNSKLLRSSKAYFQKQEINDSPFTIYLIIEKENIDHQIFCSVIQDIPNSKKEEYLILANDFNLPYNGITCSVSENNDFEVRMWYTAEEEQFDPILFLRLSLNFCDILEELIVSEVMKLKYNL